MPPRYDMPVQHSSPDIAAATCMATVGETLQTAMQHHQAGRLPAAEQAYRQILAIEPDHVDALHLVGVVLHQLGKSGLAIDYIERAIALQPHAADPHYNLGLAHQALNQFELASARFRDALHLDPNANTSAHYHLANALAEQSKFDEAVVCYLRAVELEPNNTSAWINHGRALISLGRIDEAVACYRQALQTAPDSAQTHDRLGVLLMRRGESAEAEQAFRAAIKLNPELADAHHHLGVLLIERQRETEALRFLEEAVRLKPTDAEAHNNLGNLCRAQGLLERSVFHCREAIRLKPSLVEAHNNLGVALRDLGQTAAAMQSYESAARLRPDYPDAHWNRALALLLAGDYAAGWTEYEWRWKRRGQQPRKFTQPIWDGSSLDGRTILLYAEQGLGDTLQFIRYAPLLKRQGATVVVECQAELVRLLKRCVGIDRVVSRGDPLPAFDVQAALLSLPRILGTTLENVPTARSYLSADPRRVAELHPEIQQRQELKGGIKVGIVWRGNPSHQNDRFRSVSLENLIPLMQVPNVTFFSLQKGAGREQLAALADRHAIVDLSDRLNDFHDTAAAVVNLDLVIGCDTSLVHLAGALGVPTWVLLPANPDWRWLLSRPDSRWYPTMKLFRQSRLGVWHDIVERVEQSLTEFAACS
ncbi:MAG: tetratricopeptide repeat protein [Betaproteobacteria bacterium]